MTDVPFDDLTDVYEAMIDWPKRLAREEPFYRRLFERVGARSVVDVACGTGRHAAMFHGWGLRVEAADVSPRMIERAKANFGQPPGLRWTVRGFEEPIAAQEPFDVALCVGNSLALAPDMATVEGTVGNMLAAVRGGGLAVVHVLNLWRLPDGPSVWQKFQRADLPQGEVFIAKGVHRCGAAGYMSLLVSPLADMARTRTECVRFQGIEAEELEAIARQAGAKTVECFGDYRFQPYNRAESVDLLLAAGK